jgi:hypothetical protein
MPSTRRRLALFATLLFMLAPYAHATDNHQGNEAAAIPPIVRDYARALDLLQRGAPGAPSVEALFEQGLQTAAGLMSVENNSTLLGRLNEAEFDATGQAMSGFWINREETMYVVPEPGFFVGLAREHGTAIDRAFFAAYRHTYPNPGWPAYTQQQTDYSGCTAYGNRILVQLYGEWSAYVRQYPVHYAREAAERLDDIEQELTMGNCACGDAQSVSKELGAFLATYPRSPIAPRVQRRWDAIRSGHSDMRFNCASG